MVITIITMLLLVLLIIILILVVIILIIVIIEIIIVAMIYCRVCRDDNAINRCSRSVISEQEQSADVDEGLELLLGLHILFATKSSTWHWVFV